MTFRTARRALTSFVLAATVAWATGCGDDEDEDCIRCCECSNDGSPLTYRPDPASDCSSCAEQCQVLADREFLGQEFDHADKVRCPD